MRNVIRDVALCNTITQLKQLEEPTYRIFLIKTIFQKEIKNHQNQGEKP
jgi:hypothetical protein